MIYSFLRPVFDYFIRFGDSLSQVANVVIFFGLNPNESVSGRAHRLSDKHMFWRWVKVSIDWVFSPFQVDHCELSHKADVSRAAKFLREA